MHAADSVERLISPVATASGITAVYAPNPATIGLAAFTQGIRLTALAVKMKIEPDISVPMHELVGIGVETISPPVIKPFVGIVFDQATQK